MMNLFDELIFETSKDLERKKIAVFMEVLSKKVDLDESFEMNSESTRIFPRIAGRRDEKGNEHFFWNDGSEHGLWIITFYKPEMPNTTFYDAPLEIKIETKYTY